ncbi:restriction endonuclease subunit S [Candidatus Brachybacter algidus]|uniref:restriction endonuclease subunit S n=1 Tax=Candidatus Brachybacter algidus TaxID=2982024 RepID=UPI001E0DBB3F|nr:restriction endonuclease subunit S [Candidatus Brachybacter algidus]MBK6450564.1 restriction endonuclease subunit S [Candidatus Brachybacter algidus]
MENQKNVPELRFPEFEGEWEKKKLGEVAEKITDGTHFSPKSFDHGEFLYITSKNVKDGYMELSNAQYISYEDHTSIYKRCDVKKGDILLTKDGTIGQSCINELEIEFSLLSSVAFIRTLSNYSNYFIYQLIVSDIGQKEIESQIAGQALRRITLHKINNFEFHFPTLLEQSKIATFLTAVDEKLQALKKKKSLLEVYKKGVMQKLFSQELRFKREDGKEFGDWEEKKLGEVVKIFSGNSPSLYQQKQSALNPFIKVEELNNCYKYQLISRNYTNSTKGLINKNCVIFPKRGAAILNNKVRINIVPLIMDSNLMALQCSEKIYFEFLYYFIDYEKLYKIADTSSIPQINNRHIEPYKINLPIKEEQTRIANFLSSLDEKINHTQTEITKTEVWKKGLLQKMFV